MPARSSSHQSLPEILEARIAPATLFMSPGFEVKTEQGVVVGGDAAVLAIPLAKGDTLVIDTDGNLKVDAGETTLIKVTGGRATAFFRDINANDTYDDGELTGLAFGGVFGGTVAGTVNGSVVGMLDEGGNFLEGIGPASIKGFTVDGALNGNVLAGGAIEQLTLGKAGALSEVGLIATGDAVQMGESSFDGGENAFTLNLLDGPITKSAPSIKTVTVNGSLTQVFAGNGAAGAAGGSISKLTVTALTGALDIRAGAGGEGFINLEKAPKAFAGGAGGNVKEVSITSADAAMVSIAAGAGGGGIAEYFEKEVDLVQRKVPSVPQDPESPGVEYDYIDVEVVKRRATAVASGGGLGGSIAGVTIAALGGEISEVTLEAGKGGNGASVAVEAVVETVDRKVPMAEQDPYTPGVEYDYIQVEVVRSRAFTKEAGAAAGGSIAKVTLHALEDLAGGVTSNFGDVTMRAGAGGAGGGTIGTNKSGGNGGGIDKIVGDGVGTINKVTLVAGNGGASEGGNAAGSKGGGVSNVALSAVVTALQIDGGAGAAGVGGGAGGGGGAIKGVAAGLDGTAAVTINGGRGGAGSALIGEKKVASPDQDPDTPGTEYDYVSTTFKSGVGGEGGSISKITLSALLAEGGTATLNAGESGAGGGRAAAGKAGGINGVSAGKNVQGSLASLTLNGGNGGASTKASHGGSVTDVSGKYNTLTVRSGNAAEGSGGNGGDVSGFKNLTVETLDIIAADGAGSGLEGGEPSAAKGGNGGNIKNIAALVISSASFTAGNGAEGSFIEGETETRIRRIATPYQDPYTPGTEYDEEPYEVIVRQPKAGAGGAGGKISGVTLTALGVSLNSLEFTAGAGGSNAAVSEVITDKEGNLKAYGVGGTGGAIEAIKILVTDSAAGDAGALATLIATAGAGGDGTLRGGAGGGIKITAEIAQALGDLTLTGGAGGEGLKTGIGGSLTGSVKAKSIAAPQLTPGDGAPAGSNKLVVSPPIIT